MCTASSLRGLGKYYINADTAHPTLMRKALSEHGVILGVAFCTACPRRGSLNVAFLNTVPCVSGGIHSSSKPMESVSDFLVNSSVSFKNSPAVCAVH